MQNMMLRWKLYVQSLTVVERLRLIGAILAPFIIGFAVYLANRGSWTTALAMLFVIGPLISCALFTIAHVAWPYINEDFYAGWMGQWYEFDGQQVRVFEIDGVLWAVASDCYKALGKDVPKDLRMGYQPAELARIPDSKLMGFTEAGVQAFARKWSGRDADRFGLWYHKQVSAPFHRKREINAERSAAYIRGEQERS
jgi:hypothetical protein